MSERVAGLDLLRALAILGVLLSHTLPFLYVHAPLLTYAGHFGSMGVDLFFVLSGFLIGGMLRRIGPDLRSGRELGSFWVRRWLRTLPAFYVFFALTLLVTVTVYHSRPNPTESLHVATFTQNLTTAHVTIFPEAWTLAVEEWFYLILPLSVFVGLRLTGRFRAVWWVVVAAMILVPNWLRLQQPLPNVWAVEGREPVLFRLDALAMGVLMATLQIEFPVWWRRLQWPGLLTGIVLVAWSYVLLFRLDLDRSRFGHTALFTMISVGYALLLPWASGKKAFGLRPVGTAVRSVALWSYSLYLCNVGVCMYIGHQLGRRPEESLPVALGAFAAAYVAAFGIAAASYHFIELPVLRWRDRKTRSRPVAVATSG